MKLRVAIALFALAAFAATPFVRAEEKLPECDLQKYVDQLATLKTETYGIEALPRTEFSIRKSLLEDTLRCGIAEADATQRILSGIPATEGRIGDLAKFYTLQIADARAYYETALARAGTLKTIADTRKQAKDVRSWREATYLPLAWEVNQLVTIAKNGELIKAARERLEQIEEVLAPLRLIDGEAVAGAASAARGHLDTASKAHEASLGMLDRTPRAPQEVVIGHIRGSLESLAHAYDSLIAASEEIKKLNPLR